MAIMALVPMAHHGSTAVGSFGPWQAVVNAILGQSAGLTKAPWHGGIACHISMGAALSMTTAWGVWASTVFLHFGCSASLLLRPHTDCGVA
jgi:hypothetical protein